MSKVNLYDKILSPIVTEKSTQLSEQNKIVFKVHAKANKKNLKTSLEKIFKVNVTKINIINKKNRIKVTKGKKVKIQGYKKAIITLKKGQNIDLATGI
jgi:large subunit ribosomal protein L23